MEKQPEQIENRPAQSLAEGEELKTDFLNDGEAQEAARAAIDRAEGRS